MYCKISQKNNNIALFIKVENKKIYNDSICTCTIIINATIKIHIKHLAEYYNLNK